MQFTTTLGKTFQIAEYRTRKLDREFQEAISEGAMVGVDGSMQFPAKNVQRANDILVMGMTGLSQNELDTLSSSDYNEVLNTINEEGQKKILPNSSEISDPSSNQAENHPENT